MSVPEKPQPLAWVAGALLLLLISGLSRIPYGREPDGAVLRLSWKTVGETLRVEGGAVDESVPAHMRNPDADQVRLRDYELTLNVDGAERLRKTLSPPGWQHDRPITVFEDLELPPGRHTVELRYWPFPDERAAWTPELKAVVELKPGEIHTIGLHDLPGWELVGRQK